MTRPDEVRRMVERAGRELGGLDVFVNNARPELLEGRYGSPGKVPYVVNKEAFAH